MIIHHRPNHRDACRPPQPGRTFLVIGQDLNSIADYVTEQFQYDSVSSSVSSSASLSSSTQYDHHHQYRRRRQDGLIDSSSSSSLRSFLPAGVMAYTDLQRLRGLDTPINYGSGTEYATGILWDGAVPLLQLGLWLNGKTGCQDMIHGRLDTNLDQLFTYLVMSCPAQHIYLRVGYEFDNPNFGYSPYAQLYQQAFQYLVESCRNWTFPVSDDPPTASSSSASSSPCYNKIDFVWHSWGAGVVAHTLEDYYPGDDYVDWVGVSIFTQLYSPILHPNYQTGNLGTVLDVLQLAQKRQKPIMIAESTPYGGIPHLQDPWDEWFSKVLDLIQQYDIGMWSYINCNWDEQPMWNTSGFGDTRLVSNRTIMRYWQEQVVGVTTTRGKNGTREKEKDGELSSPTRDPKKQLSTVLVRSSTAAAAGPDATTGEIATTTRFIGASEARRIISTRCHQVPDYRYRDNIAGATGEASLKQGNTISNAANGNRDWEESPISNPTLTGMGAVAIALVACTYQYVIRPWLLERHRGSYNYNDGYEPVTGSDTLAAGERVEEKEEEEENDNRTAPRSSQPQGYGAI